MAAALFGLLGLSACKVERLSKLKEDPNYMRYKTSSVTAQFCTLNPELVKPDLKLLFVIDNSTSNIKSDPQGARFQRVYNFVNDLIGDLKLNNKSDNSVFFSLMTFTDTATQEIFYDGNAQLDPFGRSVASVGDRIDLFKKEVDRLSSNSINQVSGWSDFVIAVAGARKAIDQDLDLAVQESMDRLAKGNQDPVSPSIFVVIFVTDGFPKIEDKTSHAEVEQSEDDILNAVSNVLFKDYSKLDRRRAFVEQFVLNTALYHTDQSDPAEIAKATALLQNMRDTANALLTKPGAKPGNTIGHFLDFNKDELDFRKYGFPERLARYELRDVLIRNRSLVWEGGMLKYDSDGDGLSDELELQIGTDPNQYDTDGDGVGDGVEYYVMGCDANECPAREANTYQNNLCRGLSVSPPSPVYVDSDNDTLNDCEEAILNSNLYGFHSNLSWVPDSIQFFSDINPLGPLSQFNSDVDVRGMTLYTRLKGFLPKMSSEEALRTKPFHYQVNKLSDDGARSCYQATVDNFTVWRPTDTIQVYIEESTSVRRRDWLRVAAKPANAPVVIFFESDFPKR